MAEWTGENSLIINLEMHSYNTPDKIRADFRPRTLIQP
jgi:hypothetical protein